MSRGNARPSHKADRKTSMSDQVALSAGTDNFYECVALASQQGLGIEVTAFSVPQVLDGDWRVLDKEYKAALADVPGPLTMHGPFMDLVSGSPDERINMVTYGRYEHVIRIAAGLGRPAGGIPRQLYRLAAQRLLSPGLASAQRRLLGSAGGITRKPTMSWSPLRICGNSIRPSSAIC